MLLYTSLAQTKRVHARRRLNRGWSVCSVCSLTRSAQIANKSELTVSLQGVSEASVLSVLSVLPVVFNIVCDEFSSDMLYSVRRTNTYMYKAVL